MCIIVLQSSLEGTPQKQGIKAKLITRDLLELLGQFVGLVKQLVPIMGSQLLVYHDLEN